MPLRDRVPVAATVNEYVAAGSGIHTGSRVTHLPGTWLSVVVEAVTGAYAVQRGEGTSVVGAWRGSNAAATGIASAASAAATPHCCTAASAGPVSVVLTAVVADDRHGGSGRFGLSHTSGTLEHSFPFIPDLLVSERVLLVSGSASVLPRDGVEKLFDDFCSFPAEIDDLSYIFKIQS